MATSQFAVYLMLCIVCDRFVTLIEVCFQSLPRIYIGISDVPPEEKKSGITFSESLSLTMELFSLTICKFSAYKLSRKNTHTENMCDIVFEKTKDRGGTVNRTSFYAETGVGRVL